MLHTEYVRNLNCNYERILLDGKPEEKRYQYCILSRGGIKGLLPCSLRYINGEAYLYYDISSKQNVSQLHCGRRITREWVRDFLWSFKQIQQELGRFLLDADNVLWYPEHIFQDLESRMFYFLYVPYYEGESSFVNLMEFLVEHIDYDDEVLVDCVYHMYEQLERNGEAYLRTRIFEDAECLENLGVPEMKESTVEVSVTPAEKHVCATGDVVTEKSEATEKTAKEEKKGILSIFEGKRSRGKKLREDYKQTMQQAMAGYAVAEETSYEGEEYGRTIFIEEKEQPKERPHRLLTPEGRLLASVDLSTLSIGKKKGEVDLALEDISVSRIHARITREKEVFYLEDLNSTNGTFKNGLRMQPYEKRMLEEGDEIKFGKVILIFR